MSKNLFDDSDDNINETAFQIHTNENYAKTYNSLRKKELLQKFKDKGLDASESDSDDSDSSEEDEVLDPEFDQHFLKTLASLKSKDPTIYDKNTKFFKNIDSDDSTEDSANKSKHKERKSKPVTLKDYERKIILEKGGKFVDDSEEDDGGQRVDRALSPTMAEEERNLKAEFEKVMNQNDDSSDEEFGGIFKKRKQSKAEKDKEEEDYLEWLAGKKDSIGDDVKVKLEPLKNYWSNDKLPSNEKFLRDYVLNKGYSNANNYDEIPTYEEIVGDQTHLSEDEKELEKQAEFELKYNFRYEEPDQEFIKRYPRTIETSLRLTDDKRKKKRQEIKERKLDEKKQKLKELEMVKEMKRKEIEEKIEKLKMVTGNDELGFKEDDLEEDFDPAAHDRRMQELFNDDYYQVDEGEEKPECPSDIEELKTEDWDNYDPRHEEPCGYDDNDYNCEDEDFNMDCDYDPSKAKEELQKELVANTRKRRGGRKGRRDRFMEVIKSEKPVFDPEDEKTYGEYIDEYYKIDCEDIIDDIPCRFKYVETTPNDFGLSIEEILLAKNKELNQWASLKKAIQIRPRQVEKKEQRLYKLKAKNEDLKRKIFKSLYGEGSDNEGDELEVEQANKEESRQNTLDKTENTEKNSLHAESKKARKRRKRNAQNALQSKMGDESHFSTMNNSLNEEDMQENSAKRIKTEELKHIEVSGNNIDAEGKTVAGKKKKKNKSQSNWEGGNINEKDNKLQTKSTIIKNHEKEVYKKDPLNKPTTDADNKLFDINKCSNKTDATQVTKTDGKKNPFAKVQSVRDSVGSMPPLRKNLPKSKNVKDKTNINHKSKIQNKKSFGGNQKSKIQNKKSFGGNHNRSPKGDGKNISDERLKAYGINPRKFHKRQKYGKADQ